VLANNPIIIFLKKRVIFEKKSLSILLGISLISSGISVLQPLLMQKLIDNAFIPKNLDELYFWATIILTLGLCGVFISSYNQYKYTSVSSKILFNFRKDIFEIIFLHQKTFFQKYKTGDLLSRLEGDISELQRFSTDSIFAIITSLLGMIGAFVIIFSFDATLALFSLILLPIEFFLLKPMYPKMTQKTQELRQSSAFLGSFLIESLKYSLFLRISNNIKQRVQELENLQEYNKEKILSQQKLQILFSQIPVIIALVGRAVLVFWGGVKVVEGELQVGEFIAFLTYFGMILGPIQSLLGVINNIPRVKVSLDRLSVLVPKEQNQTKNKIKLSENFNINFENLCFSYNNNELIKNLNLYIPFGEKVVIQGNNGVGKSTIFDLLTRTLTANSGEIKISGVNINKIKNNNFYSIIGLVEQHPVILGASLRDNLLISTINNTDDELINILEKVGLKSWFSSLGNGLNTTLSENGLSLSGGQKQRIAIARLMIKKPKIILLDEYTSSLDKEFSFEIESLIDRYFADTTRIIISHNQTHKNAKLYEMYDKNLHLIKD